MSLDSLDIDVILHLDSSIANGMFRAIAYHNRARKHMMNKFIIDHGNKDCINKSDRFYI